MIPLNRASYQPMKFGKRSTFKPNRAQSMIGKEIIQELQRMENSATEATYNLRFNRVRGLFKQFNTFAN